VLERKTNFEPTFNTLVFNFQFEVVTWYKNDLWLQFGPRHLGFWCLCDCK